MMATVHEEQSGAGKSLREVVDEVFGRWPLWPWSVLGLFVVGGVVGMFIGPALAGSGEETRAALGKAACAGYGVVAAALVSLLPRVAKLALLRPAVVRRPATNIDSWWPLKLLAPALTATPRLRRTPQEFTSAVTTAASQIRSLLADRLWPAWMVAFVAPVLGLMTAWQNGAKVQLRLQQGEDVATVFPAFIVQVSPPMVATIAASLVLMVAIVVIDQLTKGLLRRWSAVVAPADGEHPCVVAELGSDQFHGDDASFEPPVSSDPPPQQKRHDDLDPDELARLWQASGSRDD
jgi:uncharacterized integral membrane protein